MRLIPLLFIFTMLTGCNTTAVLTSVPKSNDDFALSKTQLDAKYPEIPNFEKRWRGFTRIYPTEESLLKEMGMPQKTERSVLPAMVNLGLFSLLQVDPITIGILFALIPPFPTTHYYQKGNYCIEAYMQRDVTGLYTQRMMYWEWKENAKTCG